MARFNKIYLGPVSDALPQVKELPAAAAITPGRLLVITAGEFALAGATTVGKVWLAQDNYLAMKDVDTDYDAGDVVVGMEMSDRNIYAARIPTGVNITAVGTELAPGANGELAIAATGDLVVAYSDEVYNNDTGSSQLIKIRPAGSQSYIKPA